MVRHFLHEKVIEFMKEKFQNERFVDKGAGIDFIRNLIYKNGSGQVIIIADGRMILITVESLLMKSNVMIDMNGNDRHK